jgi:hypothetical protein
MAALAHRMIRLQCMATSSTLGLTLASALDHSEALGGLLKRIRDSKARLAAVAPLMPGQLAAGVRAGPLDDTAWLLLVDNAASAAKLRQCLPELEAGLRAHGWPGPPIKIKVLPRAS